MKRCPICKRVETDNALVFCRVDGTRLVSESASLPSEPGTARLNSSSPAPTRSTPAFFYTRLMLQSVVALGRLCFVRHNPNYPGAHARLGLVYLQQRRYEEAIAEFQKAVELSGSASGNLSGLGYGYAVAGRRGEALQIIRELEERYTKREATGEALAYVYLGLGHKEQVLAWLEKAFQQRSGDLPSINYAPAYEPLRRDPRFADLLLRMGLEP